MDEQTAEVILQWYEFLEEQVLDFIALVPPVPPNLDAWSPRLANAITDACGLLESILYDLAPAGSKTSGKHLTITDYAIIYEPVYHLSQRKIIPFIRPLRYLTPYESWGRTPASAQPVAPDWWKIHNDLKHTRLQNLTKATLGLAMEALAGLFLTIAVLSDTELGRAVLRKEWVQLGGYVADYYLEQAVRRFPYPWKDRYVIESRLFAAVLGGPPRPDDFHGFLPDDINDFSPGRHGSSRRLIALVGKL